MAENALEVELRQGTGKGVARKLRAGGRIPGVYYGKEEAPVHLSLDPQRLRRLLEKSETGMNTLLSLEGEKRLEGKIALVRELQRDPVYGSYLHADLYAIDLEQKVEVSVPLHLTGRAVGVELSGGIVDQALREIELECLPLAIPNEILVDVTPLDIGDSIHVRDLSLPEGVELRSDPDLSVVSVVAPTKEEEEAPPVEGEPVEGAEGEAAIAEGAAAEKPDAGDGDGE